MFAEESRAKAFLYLPVFLLCLAYGGRLTGVEPFFNQFFAAIAWAYLLLADNLLYRVRGRSPLVSDPEEFLLLAVFSTALAAVAELCNLRLGAWLYTGQSSDLAVRWTGRLLAWSSALPSLLVTAQIFSVFNFTRGLKTRLFKLPAWTRVALYAAGGALLLAALAAPRQAWPLAVPGALLLAEGANLSLGLPSLLRELAGGLPSKTLRLAAAGLLCGLLWNLWNRSSGAYWEYSPPAWLQAPGLVYAGFPLLALAAYSAYCLASWLRSGRTWEDGAWKLPGRAPTPALRRAAAALLIITSYIALRAVDALTVKLYLGWV